MKKGIFSGRWTSEEHSAFMQAISVHNFCWAEISQLVGTRSAAQCRSHYQKLQGKLSPPNKTFKRPLTLILTTNLHVPEKHSKEIQCCNSDKSSPSTNESLTPTNGTSSHETFKEASEACFTDLTPIDDFQELEFEIFSF